MINPLSRPRFNLGQIAHLKVNREEQAMVTGITYRPGSIIYHLTWSDASETSHYEIELTTERWTPPET